MIVIDMPSMFERPKSAVLAFMAGLSHAAKRSPQCYFDQLVAVLVSEAKK